MDYQQKSLNDQTDYVGGIDNDAIFFDDLHVTYNTSASNRLDSHINHLNASNDNDATIFVCSEKSETPIISAHSKGGCGSGGGSSGGGDNTNGGNCVTGTVLPPMPSTAGKISLPTISQMGILSGTNHLTHTHTHLPESPPDSGSEPPYSPPQDIHGLTFTSRDFYNAAQVTNVTSCALNDLHTISISQQQQQQQQQQHLSQQYMQSPPQHQQASHSPYAHLLQISSIGSSMAINGENDNMSGVRVKHEANLLRNSSSLSPTTTSITSNANNNSRSNENGAETSTTPLLIYSGTNNHIGYEGLLNGNISNNVTSTSTSFHISFGNGENSGMDNGVTYMLNTVSDLPHVQAVGTSHASIPSTPQLSRTSTPSTPNEQSFSRKRKMTIDVDDTNYTNGIKTDLSMIMSPSRNSTCCTPTKSQMHGSKLSIVSPIPIQFANTIQNEFNSTMSARSTGSISPALSTSNTITDNALDSLTSHCPPNKGSENSNDALSPCIRFSPFQQENWHKLCDQNLQEISVVYYRVDADKGFNFSLSDDAFVCQKKNHFQITCHARLQGEAKFVKTPSGLEKIKSFHLHFFGVKLEAPNQTIRVEQSQSDRSKKPFYPVPIDLQSHIVSKVTVGRLHFSETTNNNMRKKGRPNPEQRYFQLIVALHVHTASGDFPIISQGSDKIIVRASNPGQFESDVDLCWQRGLTQDSVYHVGRVGINTDRPDESLVVHGNLKISGHIVQPSDSRAKQEIAELDTSIQLRNLQKIRIVRYRLEPEFALHSGLKHHTDSNDIVDTGVIAQEVREVIPDAVQEGGSVVLPNGNVIENFLLVNKDRILMENIGAVKELCKVTGTLESRIENLERVNQRLQRAKETELLYMRNKNLTHKNEREICSNRTLQIIIFLLVIVMAICLAAVSALYFLEHNRKQHIFKHLENIQVLSNGHLYTPESVALAEGERMYIRNRLNKSININYPSMVPISTIGKNFTFHRGQLNYFEQSPEDNTLPQQLRNDELTAIMEKPSIEQEVVMGRNSLKATAAPLLRSNKTINSKGKSKPQQGRNAVYRTNYNRPSDGTPATSSLSSSQITNSTNIPSDKISNNSELTAQQDWDSNSIDADVQHLILKPKIGQPLVKMKIPQNKDTLRHGLVGDNQKASNGDAALASTLNSNIYKMPDENAAFQTNTLVRMNVVATASVLHKTSSPLVHVPAIPTTITTTTATTTTTTSTTTTTATTSTTTPTTPTTTIMTNNPINIITSAKVKHKSNTEMPFSQLPTQANYSLEIQPIRNKSRTVLGNPTDNAEDLQSLTNNNESAYNIIRDPHDLIFYNNIHGATITDTIQHPLPSPQQDHQLIKTNNDEMIDEHLYVETFGEPEQCINKIHRTDVSNCQSMCFEESNQLLTPNQFVLDLKQSDTKKIKTSSIVVESLDKENHNGRNDNDNANDSDHNNDNDDDERDGILHENEDELQSAYNGNKASTHKNTSMHVMISGGSTISHNTKSLSKLETETGVLHIIDSILVQAFPTDNTDIMEHKLEKNTKSELNSNNSNNSYSNYNNSNNNNNNNSHNKQQYHHHHRNRNRNHHQQPSNVLLREVKRPTSPTVDQDCWIIQVYLISENSNKTFSMNEYCPKSSKSLNITIIIPLSRYFNQLNIQIHLISSPPLQWMLCNNNYGVNSKTNLKQLQSQQQLQQQQQQQQKPQEQLIERLLNTSVLLLNLPNHGNFIKDIKLRATTNDQQKENLCHEKAYETNRILQYNFRVLRNCD